VLPTTRCAHLGCRLPAQRMLDRAKEENRNEFRQLLVRQQLERSALRDRLLSEKQQLGEAKRKDLDR
jgi:hypothetical protein